MEQRWSLSSNELVKTLRAAGCVYAEDEAVILQEAAISQEHLQAMVAQRVQGIPLEHIVGWADFDGLRVGVSPGVFVPRQRSGFLVEEALHVLTRSANHTPVVVDLCCGSGALGTALAQKLLDQAPRGATQPVCELYAADVDATAVACAAKNIARFNGWAYCGHLFDPLPQELRGTVDVILANAPYVPSGSLDFMPREARLYEPVTALDGGPDGLALHRSIAAQARSWLRPGGALLLESSAEQAVASTAILEAAGLSSRSATSESFDATVVVGIFMEGLQSTGVTG